MPTKAEMEAQGTFNKWLAGYQSARQAVSDSVLYLNDQKLIALPEDQADIAYAVTLQQQKINDLDNQRLLFYAAKITMTPPDDATIAHIKAFSDKADKLIAQAKAADQIVSVADQAVTVFEAATQKKTT